MPQYRPYIRNTCYDTNLIYNFEGTLWKFYHTTMISSHWKFFATTWERWCNVIKSRYCTDVVITTSMIYCKVNLLSKIEATLEQRFNFDVAASIYLSIYLPIYIICIYATFLAPSADK